MEAIVRQVRAALAAQFQQLQAERRHLHSWPELSFKEERTGKWIAQRLAEEGIPVRSGIAGTGVIGVVEGSAPGRTFCLRADIDALPIQELGDVPYRSQVPGVMHACGHDAHTAMVLAAGRVLHALRAQWQGTVLLLFQPGEELVPGGASIVLAEDALKDPRPEGIMGQHVTPELAVGKVGFRSGPFMASSDELYVTVQGRGGHASQLARLIDPLTIAARLIVRLQEEFAATFPQEPKVLAFGRMIADGATNVIPDTVSIEGTFRAFDEVLRRQVQSWLPERAAAICAEHGASCHFEVRRGYPVVACDPALTERVRAAAEAYLGADQVVTMDQRMGSEDFGYYTHAMPGTFMRLGTGHAERPSTTAGLHTAAFDIDEQALAIGAGVMVMGALAELDALPKK